MENNELVSNRDLTFNIFFSDCSGGIYWGGHKTEFKKNIRSPLQSSKPETLVTWISIFREDAGKSKVIQETL